MRIDLWDDDEYRNAIADLRMALFELGGSAAIHVSLGDYEDSIEQAEKQLQRVMKFKVYRMMNPLDEDT